MLKGKSLVELAQELARQQESKRDFRAPTSAMTLFVQQPTADSELRQPQLTFGVGDKFQGPLTELMHDQVGVYTGVPSKYYDRMREQAPALLASNVNLWLRRSKDTRLVRTLDGKARSFLSNRYRALDNFDVANATLPILIAEQEKLGGLQIVSADVTETKMYVKVISKRLTYEVKKGDVVEVGNVISNSEVGLATVKVEPFLRRCICDNGAIVEDWVTRKFPVSRHNQELEEAYEVFQDETLKQSDLAFMLKLGDVVRASFDDKQFERLKGMTIEAGTRKIKLPINELVEEVTNRYHLPERYRDSFLKKLIEGGDATQWGLANAVTATANDALDYEEATRLEKLGGELMVLPAERWGALNAA